MAPRETGAHKDGNRKQPQKRSTDQKAGSGTGPATQPNQTQPNQNRPNVDFGGMPDLSGRKEGDEWSVTRPNGEILNYRVPHGNGNKSVDISVVGADGGLLGTMRAAMGDGGGFQEWVDVVGGPSVYVGQDTKYSNPYAAMYNSTTSTSGPPDSAKAYLPDWQQEFPLLENGQVVGELGVIPGAGGYPDVYQNVYRDKFGNLSYWQNRSTESGGMTGWQQGAVDSRGYGWQILPTGTSGSPQRWEITPGTDGARPFLTNTETTPNGTHFRTINLETGVRTDKYTTEVPGKGYYLSTGLDGTVTKVGDDGSLSVWDVDGKLVTHREGRPTPERPDDRGNWEKLWDGTGDVLEGAWDAAKGVGGGIRDLTGFGADGAAGEAWGSLWNGATNFADGFADSAKGAWHGLQSLAGVGDIPASQAWEELAWSASGPGVGLLVLGMDTYDYMTGDPDVSLGTLGSDAFAALDLTSRFLIGTQLEGASEHPAETLGNATFGILTLLGPKGAGALRGKLPPGAGTAAVGVGKNALGELGRMIDEAFPSGAIPALDGPALPELSGPWARPNLGVEMRNGGDGASGPGRGHPGNSGGHGGDGPEGAPARSNPPLLPADFIDPRNPERSAPPEPRGVLDENGNLVRDPSEYAIPWYDDPALTPEGHWPVGVKERKNDSRWIDTKTGKPVKMPPWAKNSAKNSEPIPPKAAQDLLEVRTTPIGPRKGIQTVDPSGPNWLDNTGLDSNGLGFFGDALGRAKAELAGENYVVGGEQAKIPVPGGKGEEYFKPDGISVKPDGTVGLHEFKVNDSPYRQRQFDGYSFYADGNRKLVIDEAMSPDLADKLRAAGVDPGNVVVSSVETTRWDREFAPTDEVLKRAADTGFGDMIRGTKADPEWRASALDAYSALNSMAAQRSLRSGQYFDAINYEARHQALEALKGMAPSQQALIDNLLTASQLVGGLFGDRPVGLREGGQLGDVGSMDTAAVVPAGTQIRGFAGLTSVRGTRSRRKTDQSITINIAQRSVRETLGHVSESLRGWARLTHVR